MLRLLKTLFLLLLAACTLRAQATGYLDTASCTTATGWAWDGSTDTPVSVDIYDTGAKVATVAANTFRQDLLAAGVGNGKHGFVVTLALPGGNHNITAQTGAVVLNDDTVSQQGSGAAFSCAAPAPPPAPASVILPFVAGYGLIWGPPQGGYLPLSVDSTQLVGIASGATSAPFAGSACAALQLADGHDGSLLACLNGKWGKITDSTQLVGIASGATSAPFAGSACAALQLADGHDGSLLVCLNGKWGKITGIVFQ